jgi:hypothetical protein
VVAHQPLEFVREKWNLVFPKRQTHRYKRVDDVTEQGCLDQPWRNEIIKIMVLLHSADGVNWQSPPKGTSLKTLTEAEEQGFIVIRGEFQKRQFCLTELGSEYVERDKRRLGARKL